MLPQAGADGFRPGAPCRLTGCGAYESVRFRRFLNRSTGKMRSEAAETYTLRQPIIYDRPCGLPRRRWGLMWACIQALRWWLVQSWRHDRPLMIPLALFVLSSSRDVLGKH